MIKIVPDEKYDWKRFWCPRDGSINLHDAGYLVDPDSRYGRHWNADLCPFDSISNLPCLALLGEPGIGKTTTMQAEREKIDAQVRAEGGDTFWLNLNAYGSEVTLRERLFGNEKLVSWREGDHRLHVFLDGLDECRLRIDNVAALLVEALEECPVERLSLRVSCRTADWPNTLEKGLRRLWGEDGFGAYELAPLRRVDVAAAAAAEGLDADAFLQSVHEAEAVPLAIKPVTLEFLLESYSRGGRLPSRQTDVRVPLVRELPPNAAAKKLRAVFLELEFHGGGSARDPYVYSQSPDEDALVPPFSKVSCEVREGPVP